MPEQFITAYSVATGRKHDVPEEWLDHPILGRDFRRTPSDSPAGNPFDAWTIDQLREYAATNGIDLGGATRKAELVAAITDHHAPVAGEGS